MHTTRVLGIGKVFTTALLSLQAKNMLTPGQPVAVKSFFLKCTNPPSRVSSSSLGRGSAVPSGVVCGVQLMLVSTPVRVTRPPTAGPGYLRCRCQNLLTAPRACRCHCHCHPLIGVTVLTVGCQKGVLTVLTVLTVHRLRTGCHVPVTFDL